METTEPEEGPCEILRACLLRCMFCVAALSRSSAVSPASGLQPAPTLTESCTARPALTLNFCDATAVRTRSATLAASASDAEGRTAIAYGVFGVPETYFIDGEGRIVDKYVGPLDRGTIAALLGKVKGGGR